MSGIMWRLAAILGLICLSFGGVLSREYKFIADRIEIHNRHVIVDRQPLKNNTLVYAACGIPREREFMNCSVTLVSYHTANSPNKIDRKVCNVFRRAPANSYIMQDFQLKLLFSDYVIFMWTERLIKEDEKNPARQLIYRTMEMSSCKSIEKNIDFVAHSRPINVDDFYMVPYEETFDLYYNNETLCNNKMCGLTQNKRGKIINGPVPTYLPSDQFRYENFVYPVKPISAAWGLFILSKQLRLVGSNAGEIKYLMDYPTGLQGQAFSCNNGYLGFCWITQDVNQLNCTQFNSIGKQTMRFALGQNYHKFGSWLAVSNSRNGGMLLMTSNCNDQSWCESNTDAVQFKLYKVEQSTQGYVIGLIEQFIGIDCNYVRDVKTEIFERDNGDICFSFVCHVQDDEPGNTHFYLKSHCVSVSNAESSVQRSKKARCDDSFDPNCNPIIIT